MRGGIAMALCYILNTEQYKGETFKIGEIMEAFTDSLRKKTGLSLNVYRGLHEEDMTTYDGNNQGVQVLNEEVLWKNLTDEEKVNTILTYINRMSDESKDELIIIDPYLFKKPKIGENDTLKDILQSCEHKKIIAIVGKSKADGDYQKEISNLLGDRLEIYYTDEIHDRFWIINRKKGFLTGTSINGIGKKYCVIQSIESDDVKAIIEILVNELKLLV